MIKLDVHAAHGRELRAVWVGYPDRLRSRSGHGFTSRLARPALALVDVINSAAWFVVVILLGESGC